MFILPDCSHVAPNIVSHRLHGHSGKRYNCRFTTQINQGNAALIKQCKSRRAIQQHIITSIVTRLRAEKITTRRITRGKNANIVSPPVRKTILKKAANQGEGNKNFSTTAPQTCHNWNGQQWPKQEHTTKHGQGGYQTWKKLQHCATKKNQDKGGERVAKEAACN